MTVLISPQIPNLQEQIRDREYPCQRKTGNPLARDFRSREDP
jgi:hypothetical protein